MRYIYMTSEDKSFIKMIHFKNYKLTIIIDVIKWNIDI